jgi:hypothetical protein
VHRFSRDDTWRFNLNSGTGYVSDRAVAVNSVTQRVDNSAEKAITDGHIDDRAGPLDDIAFLDLSIFCE